MSALWQRVARLFLARSDFLAYAWDLAASVPEVSLPAGAAIRVAGPADFTGLAEFTHRPDFRGSRLDRGELEWRYQQGEVCFLAEWRGEVASVSWIRFADASLPLWGVWVPLRPGEAYITGVFTLPAYQGRGLATTVALAQLGWLRDRGVRAAYLWVHPRNDAMLKVLRRSGWRPVGRVVQVLWRGKTRRPLVNVAAALNPQDPLAFCSAERLSFAGGVSLFRRAPEAWFPGGAAPPAQRESPALSRGGGAPALRSSDAE